MSTPSTINPDLVRENLGQKIQAQFANEFEAKIDRWVLISSRRQPHTAYFANNRFTIPEMGKFHHDPARIPLDSLGNRIDGAILLEDTYGVNEEIGDYVLKFSSKRAVAHILGITLTAQNQLSMAESKIALAGISFLPYTPTPEMVASIREDGLARAYETDVRNASDNVQAWIWKNEARTRIGMGTAIPDARILADQRIVDQYNLEQSAKLSGIPIVSPPTSAVTTIAEAIDDETDSLEAELEMEMYCRLKAHSVALAEKIENPTEVDEFALVQDLLSRPSIQIKLRKAGISIRKKGFMKATLKDLKSKVAEQEREAELAKRTKIKVTDEDIANAKADTKEGDPDKS